MSPLVLVLLGLVIHLTTIRFALGKPPIVFKRAETRDAATTAEIKDALEDCVGHPPHHSVVYRFLERNEWRKSHA